MICSIHSITIITSLSSLSGHNSIPSHENIKQKNRVSAKELLLLFHQVPHHQQARHCRPQQRNDYDWQAHKCGKRQQRNDEANDAQRKQTVPYSTH